VGDAVTSPDYSQDVKDIIDGLGDSPTPDAIYHAVRNYSVDHVVAATASAAKAGGGGGGGSLPAGGSTGQALTKASSADNDVEWTGGATSREDFIGGEVVTVANNSNGRVTWFSLQGSTLLDLTDPSIPVAIAAGAYAVSVAILPTTNMTADGFYGLVLELDSDGDDASIETESRLATAAKPLPKVAISGTYYIPAGGTIRAKVFNFDGAISIDFGLTSAFVQKVA
jgi:hypothetical protein